MMTSGVMKEDHVGMTLLSFILHINLGINRKRTMEMVNYNVRLTNNLDKVPSASFTLRRLRVTMGEKCNVHVTFGP